MTVQFVLLRDRHEPPTDRRDFPLTGEFDQVQGDGLRSRRKLQLSVVDAHPVFDGDAQRKFETRSEARVDQTPLRTTRPREPSMERLVRVQLRGSVPMRGPSTRAGSCRRCAIELLSRRSAVLGLTAKPGQRSSGDCGAWPSGLNLRHHRISGDDARRTKRLKKRVQRSDPDPLGLERIH